MTKKKKKINTENSINKQNQLIIINKGESNSVMLCIGFVKIFC